MSIIDEIILGCKRNDAKCQKILYEQYRGYALKIVFRYISSYDKAVDVSNDGFVKIFLNIKIFVGELTGDSEKKFMGWLKKIMVNTSIDELRKENLQLEIRDIAEEVYEINNVNDNTDEFVKYKDLLILIKELTPQYRMVFNMFIIDGYNHAEIAELLQITVSNSKSILSRARAILQEKIIKMDQEKVCCI